MLQKGEIESNFTGTGEMNQFNKTLLGKRTCASLFIQQCGFQQINIEFK